MEKDTFLQQIKQKAGISMLDKRVSLHLRLAEIHRGEEKRVAQIYRTHVGDDPVLSRTASLLQTSPRFLLVRQVFVVIVTTAGGTFSAVFVVIIAYIS
jgi:hypothetical protein